MKIKSFFASFFSKKEERMFFFEKRRSPPWANQKTLILMLGLLSVALPAHALETAPVNTARDSASLVSEADTIAPGKPIRIGLHLKLAPGWHTYWSNPGDAGAPPTIDITGAQASPIAYPAPEKLTDGPFTSYAYTGDVLLPVTVTPKPGATSLSIDADATWLVCAQVCVPEEAKFHLDIPAGAGAPGPQSALFTAADAHTPRPSPFPAYITSQGTLWLAAKDLPVQSAIFYPSEAGVIDQGAPQTLATRPGAITLALKPVKRPAAALSGVLALTDRGGQTEYLSINATQQKLPAPAQPAPATSLAKILLLAFAGGLVLNLMPCVLPVLAFKALALARMSGSAPHHVRKEAILYTIGVLAAFCTIGGITFAARAAGGSVGWGVQFQSAIFTTAMAWLLFAIGLNLSGVFEFGSSLAGTGQGLASRGSFFTGLLAVVVATPCTAPFMGAALAAALAMPPATGMLIFVALGLGLAAPYVALAVSPGAARLLPRPGAWMDVLKHLLAFPMYGAGLWMVWIASQQVSPIGLAAVFASLLLVGFAAWAYGTAQRQDRPALLNGAAALAVLVGVACLFGLGSPAGAAPSGVAADGSEPYSAARLAELRGKHRPVLVDMSAAWCVTCLVNERIALTPASVRDAFARHKVAYLKGDWTRQDANITAFLHDHDRSGVPLYVYYPAEGEPQILPQILTPDTVIGVVDQG
jgi:thiol:disulfide interchange protein DsbD